LFHLWIVYRFVASGRRWLNSTSIMSLVGMALGVACLTAAMGVVSGFENTLRRSIIDISGDLIVVHRGEKTQNVEALISQIKKTVPESRTYTPFVELEGLITGQGRLGGVRIEGFDPTSVDKVLNLQNRLAAGEYSFAPFGSIPAAMVGKALAKKFSLKVGEPFKVVLPMPSKTDSTGFSPKVMTFYLRGMLDLGKADYDERFIVTDLKSAQEFAAIGENFTGMRIKLDDSDHAMEAARRLSRELGTQFYVADWSETNKNMFRAVTIERLVIFFVVLIMVIAASFNIASNLFVSVLRKYADISILRAMGFTKRDVARVFILQGLFYGAAGTVIGLILGLMMCAAFVIAQRYMVLLPVETYRLDHVGVDIRFVDFGSIILASLIICLLATLVPAWRGANLDPVEGLRYE
jgi:lipoprotein-releasing system permease protein